MDRIIHDLANTSAHLNYTRFLDLIADHERNPNQHPHSGWGHPPGENSSVGYELSAPKPGPSIVYPTSLATVNDSIHAARSLALHENPPRNEGSFK